MNNSDIEAARRMLGGFIQQRREQMGLARRDLGRLVGVTANTIHGVESGRFAMNVDLLMSIMFNLNIKMLNIEEFTKP